MLSASALANESCMSRARHWRVVCRRRRHPPCRCRVSAGSDATRAGAPALGTELSGARAGVDSMR
jgi:hypothetical protein